MTRARTGLIKKALRIVRMTSNIVSEADLKNRLSKGDFDAFHMLFDDYYPKSKAFISALIKDEKAAEDLCQDIFMKIWNLRETLPEIRSVKSWIYRMSRSSALNYLRDRKRLFQITDLSIAGSDDVEGNYAEKEKELIIRMYVDSMPAQRRRVFSMSRYQGISNAKIAEKLGISKKTVENHLNLALKGIRELALTLTFFL